METTMTDTSQILMDKIVKVEPVYRTHGRSVFPKGHDGEFMFSGCKQGYCLPIDIKRGQLVSILTDAEQAFFEKKLHMEPGSLSIYKDKKTNFWSTFRVVIDKEGLTLNLSDPMDNLRWRVLRVVPQVAPSWDERNNSAEYVFALVDNDYKVQDEVKKADRFKEAYKFFGSIEHSIDKMKDFLIVYGRKPASNAKQDFLKSEISKIIDEDINGFLAIANDKNFEMKLFISRCLEVGALHREGKNKYILPGGDIIGITLDETIEYLRSKKNSDVLAVLKAKVETANPTDE